MAESRLADGIKPGRLNAEEYEKNFSDLHPPLDDHEALVAADRCYFCHDAPCVTACPTEIDIPMFIRQISTGSALNSAKTIFDQNILGGMCARVCPTETLCEQACVREVAEGKPVDIGLLQRYATDKAMTDNVQFYDRSALTNKKIAVVGAGPAGLACAHRLSMHGHDVVVYDANEKAGGLNEYGIAAYKTVDEFAQAEVDYVTEIGGIEIVNGKKLGDDLSLAELSKTHDAVFLSIGLSGVNTLGIGAGNVDCVDDAVDFIAGLRQSRSKADISVGRRVVVIGGGMTAIDAAVQAKLLGAEEVTICYRRGAEQMNASVFEQDLATKKGVVIRHWLQPTKIESGDGSVSTIELEYTEQKNGKLSGTGNKLMLPADQILVAIGQTFTPAHLNGSSAALELEKGRIKVNNEFMTSLPGVWAGGDCINHGEDLTVSAVAHGRDAAESINNTLTT